MVLDTRIALGGQGIDTANPLLALGQQLRQDRDTRLRQEVLERQEGFQERQFEFQREQAEADRTFREKQFSAQQRAQVLAQQVTAEQLNSLKQDRKLKSMAIGAMGVLDSVDENGNIDVEAAISSLERRRNALQEVGTDTTETDQTIAALRSGDQAQIQGIIEGAVEDVEIARAFGVLPQPKEEKRFKVAPGEKLVTASGKEIATGGEKPPKDMRPALDEQGQPTGEFEPVPGSKLDREVKKEEEALQKRKEQQINKAKITQNAAQKALDFLNEKKVGLDPTGLAAQLTRGLGGSDAQQLEKLIDPIKANLGFAELQAMREASPTGGALGQVAVRELEFLQSALTNLDVTQKTEFLEQALNDVKTHYNNWLNVMEQAEKSEIKFLGFE